MNRVQRADFTERLANFLADFGVYAFSVIGILTSQYLPQFRQTGFVNLEPINWGTFLISCILAFMISFTMDINSDVDGARKHWKRRAAFALTNGAMWQTIIGG